MSRSTVVSESSMVTQPQNPRVLIFSQRNIFKKTTLFRCPHYEFEDTICKIDAAEILAPEADPSNLRHRIARRVAFHVPVALNSGIPPIELKKRYDLFLAICGAPGDLLMVNSVSNWRDVCKSSVCLIDEIWLTWMHSYRYFLRLLQKFDVVLLYYSQSVKPLSDRIGRKVVFMPPGVDAIAFCPYPERPQRVVDVYSIGRRSATTHQSLLNMVAEHGLFYLYDSVKGGDPINAQHHRALLANVSKRSRYYIVNPALIDRPEIRGSQAEAGNRYFEGAAAGAIMIGERPNNEEFGKLFDWPDAVVHLPYDSSNIQAIIKDLDEQPERQEKIRRTNVVGALTKHDWVYRWETVLRTVGLEPMPGFHQRKERLGKLAKAAWSNEAIWRQTRATRNALRYEKRAG